MAPFALEKLARFSLHSDVAQGFGVSRRDVLRNLLLQRQLCNQPLLLAILLLQFLESFGLIQSQPAVFPPPAVERLDRDLGIPAGLRCGLSVRGLHFNLPWQQPLRLCRNAELRFRRCSSSCSPLNQLRAGLRLSHTPHSPARNQPVDWQLCSGFQ